MSLLSSDCRFIYIIILVWEGKKGIIDQLLEDICQIHGTSSITLVRAYLGNY